MPAPDAITAAETEAVDRSVQRELQLIVDAARRAGQIAMEYFGRNPEVWMKEGDSPVSEADHAADEYLRKTLLAARPDHGWLSEETTDNSDRVDRRRIFVVDPIDGTRGFIKGMKQWCVSIAIVENARPLCGVLECPALGETYVASRGGGAWLNGRRLAPAAVTSPPRISGPKSLIEQFSKTTGEKIGETPFIPSLAYRMAMVAAGHLEGTYARANSHDWDIAAADLVLREAGAVLLDARGNEIRYNQTRITHGILIAAAKPVCSAMLLAASQSSKDLQ